MFDNNSHIHIYRPGTGTGADNPLEVNFFSIFFNLVIYCKFIPSNYFVTVFPLKCTGDQIGLCGPLGCLVSGCKYNVSQIDFLVTGPKIKMVKLL